MYFFFFFFFQAEDGIRDLYVTEVQTCALPILANDLNGRNDNRRVRDSQFSVNRGAILIGSTPIAQSKPSNDQYQYQRTYASGPVYAPVTGYYSYLFGRAGIELNQN